MGKHSEVLPLSMTRTSGPYASTCDGSPSGNGNGNGNGKQPCAGCVGNADDKNPPGQQPGGSDPNAGYECDRNNGVGKTNPAHSGCGVTARFQYDVAVGPVKDPPEYFGTLVDSIVG